jgi:uncharacterized protein DUF732
MERQRSKYRGRHRAGPSGLVRVLRAGAGVVVLGGVVFAVMAFAPAQLDHLWTPANADERFVAAVQAQGRPVPSGDGEVLVVRAAQKLCESRAGGTTSAERRASALTSEEIDAVRRTFGDDSAAFLKVAQRAYCPLSPLNPDR